MSSTPRFAVLPLALAAVLAGCGRHDGSSSSALLAPASQPADPAGTVVPTFPPPSGFVDGLSNPYLGFSVGSTFHYEGDTADGHESIVVEVTHKTKTITGVRTTVVHDQAYLDGELVEDTNDWYAQDTDGNVWYFGEDSKQIEDGKVIGTEGSWQAGVNGAAAGITMLAHPTVGTQYQQEFAEGVAEDMAKVLSLTASVTVPYGSFPNCLKTQEWTPLEPGARETKYYSSGVGLVLEVEKGGARIELTELTR